MNRKSVAHLRTCARTTTTTTKEERKKETKQTWHQKHPEYRTEYNQKNKAKMAAYRKEWRKNNPDVATRHYYKTRIGLMSLLGNECNTCGFPDTRALQIDHIHGGGTKDVKKYGYRVAMYSYYLKHPEIAKASLQILCANCNWIKRYEQGEDYK